jgi:hypothetical protein
LDDVAQTVLGVFLLLISAEITFGAGSKVRVSGIDAMLDARSSFCCFVAKLAFVHKLIDCSRNADTCIGFTPAAGVEAQLAYVRSNTMPLECFPSLTAFPHNSCHNN